MLVMISLASCSKSATKLRIGIIKPSIDHLPLSYALEKGYLDASKFELSEFSSGWELQEALVGKQVDLAIMPFTFAYNAVEKGFPIRTISFFERETDGIVARNPYKNLADLNGKKIGLLRASSLDVLLTDLEAKQSSTYEKVFFRTPNEMIAALAANEVEAIVVYVPLIQKLGEEHQIVHWFSADYPAHPCCDIVVNQKMLSKAKQAQVIALKPGLLQAIEKINARDEQLLAFVEERFAINRKQAIDALDHTVFRLGLDSSGIDFQQNMMNISIQSGYLDKAVSPESIYWDIWK